MQTGHAGWATRPRFCEPPHMPTAMRVSPLSMRERSEVSMQAVMPSSVALAASASWLRAPRISLPPKV